MKRLTLSAPAKINLTLDVVGKREDNYHLIRTVMQTVTLSDTVTVTQVDEPGIFLRLSDKNLPTDRRNTAYAAAKAFWNALPEAKRVGGIDIYIDKKIPQQAGLAGGSADAAAVLRGLNRLWDDPFSIDALCAFAVSIGADVPFCVRGGSALATGIGEVLEPVKSLSDELFVVICKPTVSVSTAEAYAAVDAYEGTALSDEVGLLAALEAEDAAAVGERLFNVFEDVLKLPEVEAICTKMREFAPLGCRMSGSGSAVYALFQNETAARDCREALRDFGTVFLCRPLSNE